MAGAASLAMRAAASGLDLVAVIAISPVALVEAALTCFESCAGVHEGSGVGLIAAPVVGWAAAGGAAAGAAGLAAGGAAWAAISMSQTLVRTAWLVAIEMYRCWRYWSAWSAMSKPWLTFCDSSTCRS